MQPSAKLPLLFVSQQSATKVENSLQLRFDLETRRRFATKPRRDVVLCAFYRIEPTGAHRPKLSHARLVLADEVRESFELGCRTRAAAVHHAKRNIVDQTKLQFWCCVPTLHLRWIGGALFFRPAHLLSHLMLFKYSRRRDKLRLLSRTSQTTRRKESPIHLVNARLQQWVTEGQTQTRGALVFARTHENCALCLGKRRAAGRSAEDKQKPPSSAHVQEPLTGFVSTSTRQKHTHTAFISPRESSSLCSLSQAA